MKAQTLIVYSIIFFTFAVAYFTPTEGKEIPGIIGFGLLTVGSLFLRSWPAFYISLTFFIMCLYFKLETEWMANLPIHALLIPLLLSSATMFAIQRQPLSWLKLGKIKAHDFLIMLLLAVSAAISLLIWANWTNSFGDGEQIFASLKDLPLWLIVGVLIPAFALLMPVAEEFLYRGIMLDEVQKLTSSWWAAAIVQALTYAAFHYGRGFPNGSIGFILVFIFGMGLAWLRIRTSGLLASYLVHMAADLVIGYYLVFRFL